MIGRTELFRDIPCPFNQSALCDRPYCHYKHARETQQSRAASESMTISQDCSASMPFIGYMGYVGGQGQSNRPLPSAAPVASSSSATSAITADAPWKKPAPAVSNSAVEASAVAEKKRGVPELIDDEILNPQKRAKLVEEDEKVKKPPAPLKSAIQMRKAALSAAVVKRTPSTSSSDKAVKLNEYVKSLAQIDSQIAELQRKVDAEKKGIAYVPTKKEQLKPPSRPTTQKSTAAKPSAKVSGSKSKGYVPTPISQLKSSQKEKDEAILPDMSDEDEYDPTAILPAAASTSPIATPKQKSSSSSSVDAVVIDDLFDVEPRKQQTIKRPKTEKTTKSEPASTSSADANAKQRVAYAAANQPSASRQRYNVAQSKAHLPTPTQQLQMRFQKLQDAKEALLKNAIDRKHGAAESSGGSSGTSSTTPHAKARKQDLKGLSNSHRDGASAATVPKGEQRQAHLVKVDTSAKPARLTCLEPQSGKIPLALRQRYLDMFHAECAKFCSSEDEARTIAQGEEKAIKDRASTKGGYTSAAVNVLKRLRECSATHSAPSASSTNSISHEAVIAGKAKGSFTVGLNSRQVRNTSLDEPTLYDCLAENFLLTAEQLESNGFPIQDPDNPEIVSFKRHEQDARRRPIVDDRDFSRVCSRCGTEYRLTDQGFYTVAEECIYHYGRAWKTKSAGAWESRYNCCGSDLNTRGCCVAECHVTDTMRKSDLLNFVHSPSPAGLYDGRSKKVYAVDCEMIYTVWGSALARVSVVDMALDLVLDVIVRPPHRIADCNTRFSGLTPELLETAECDLDQARERLFEFVNEESILIGHSLESDLKALKIVHEKVVDTSVVFPHRLGPPYKRALKTIVGESLQKIIQEDVGGHDSKEDASSCMELMIMKAKREFKM